MKLCSVFVYLIFLSSTDSKKLLMSLKSSVSSVTPKQLVTVQTENGAVVGYITENPPKTEIRRIWTYMGIPFANPPIDEKRFKDPDVNMTKKKRFAFTKKQGCLRGIKNFVVGNEDCLHLNIFSPVGPDPKLKTPVMVWIHGGGFFGGNGNVRPAFSSGIIDDGVIFVSINYRLGILGALCTSDEASPGNYHIKDQIAALQWIKKNIENFGGDPDRITIHGESAGAASVHYLIQAKQAKGLFHAAISQSGSTLSPWAVKGNPLEVIYLVLNNLGMNLETNTTKEIVDKLRTVDFRKLQLATAPYQLSMEYNWDGVAWAPCIENTPDPVVEGRTYDRLKNGEYNQVPLLTGFNSNEFRVIFDPDVKLDFDLEILTKNFTNYVPRDMNIKDPKLLKDAADKIVYFYYGSNSTTSNVSLVKFASDHMFVRPIYKTAQLMSRNSPVYLYRFAYNGTAKWKNYTIGGVGHGRELELLTNIPQKSDEARLAQKRIIKLWTNFAKYGNPTPEEGIDPLFGIKWPKVSPEGDVSYLNFESNLTIEVNPEAEAMTFWDELYKKYGNPPYNTY